MLFSFFFSLVSGIIVKRYFRLCCCYILNVAWVLWSPKRIELSWNPHCAGVGIGANWYRTCPASGDLQPDEFLAYVSVQASLISFASQYILWYWNFWTVISTEPGNIFLKEGCEVHRKRFYFTLQFTACLDLRRESRKGHVSCSCKVLAAKLVQQVVGGRSRMGCGSSAVVAAGSCCSERLLRAGLGLCPVTHGSAETGTCPPPLKGLSYPGRRHLCFLVSHLCLLL